MKLKMMVLALLAVGMPASAQKVLITNDDGLTSNVKALYEALKNEGYDVVVSVPCTGQSGMGAAIKFLRPLGPLQNDCHNGAAKASDPGAGLMTRADMGPDFYYVDGTPVMALLYGLDIVAPDRWGRAPDLVLSGPNEGQNVGSIIISSGTVSNVQYAAVRGIPAVALSADLDTTGRADLANPKSKLVASRSVQLVKMMGLGTPEGTRFLKPGYALNVNFPKNVEAAEWRHARIGSYDAYKVSFAKSIGSSGLPGVTISPNVVAPKPDEKTDEAAVTAQDIAVSLLQFGYEPDNARRGAFARSFQRELKRRSKHQ